MQEKKTPVVSFNTFIFQIMIQERQSTFNRSIVLFISYIAVLQVLYALQDLLVSIPFLAMVMTVYLLIIQRTLSARKSVKSIFNSTGSNTQGTTTHERDLQHLLIVQTEQVLQTNLEQFRKVNFSR